MKFLLESMKYPDKKANILLPKYDFVYSLLEAADFHNWRAGKNEDTVAFLTDTDFAPEHLRRDCVPVGSVEFCSAWYEQMGCRPIRPRPMNIPLALDSLAKHTIIRTNNLKYDGTRYFGKSMTEIKAAENGWYTRYTGKEPMFFAGEIPGIVAEWRLFVCQGEIVDARCYIGAMNFAAPDMKYCRQVVDAVSYHMIADAYTLDVAVTKNGETDILELHDFFACGLYGFDDMTAIRKMVILTQRKLLKTCT